MAQSYGIKISRPGFDVNSCADYNLLFNSAWPSLAVAFQTTVTGTYNGGLNWTATATHNLNFVPLCFAWVVQNGIRTVDRIYPSVTKTGLSISYTASLGQLASTDTATFFIVCYNVDISTSASYSFLSSAAVKQPYDPKFGIKVSKANKSTTSTDLRDYVLHSRAQSPAILNIAVSTTSPIIYTMPVGYTCWVYGFSTNDNTTWNNAVIYSQAVPSLTIPSTNNFNLDFSGQLKGSLVVLRDPLFAPATINVSY